MRVDNGVFYESGKIERYKMTDKQTTPILSLGANLFKVIESKEFKCALCGLTFDKKDVCPIIHGMFCSGV